MIGADSHTCSHGALGAFATGVGSTDFVGAIKQGTLWFMVPSTLRFNLSGKLGTGVTAKDLILTIIGRISGHGANYKAMEFSGEGLAGLSLESRITIANLAVEAGAKNAIMEADEKVTSYLRQKRSGYDTGQVYASDSNAVFEKVLEYDLATIQPVIAFPNTVDNVRPVEQAEGIRLDQVFVGSCSNGRLEDLKIVTDIIERKKIAKNLHFIISPASQSVYLEALSMGLITVFLEAGAMVMNPNCSTCWGPGCYRGWRKAPVDRNAEL